MLSGIVLEIACPETRHISGCFDIHTQYIYLFGCVLLTSLHGAPIRSYFVEALEIALLRFFGLLIATLSRSLFNVFYIRLALDS